MIDDFFEVSPRVVRSGVGNTIAVKARYEQRSLALLVKEGKIEVTLIPNCGTVPPECRTENNWTCKVPSHFDPADPERLLIELPPQDEGELRLVVRRLDAGGTDHLEILRIPLYVLDEDLYEKRPFRGDLHVHSSWSECGRRLDDPRYVAVSGRENGLDFMAITDHQQMEGSVVARAFIEKLPTDFLLVQGEECHLLEEKQPTLFCRNRFIPENHIVNFGGSQGVIRYSNEHFDEYMTEVKRRASELDPAIPENLRFYMAGADWVMDKIHEFGGLAVFCHPFWRYRDRRNLPDAVREHILKQNRYDAMEVTGLGSENNADDYEENALCLSWYEDACIRAGRRIPLVGNTDSHNADVLPGKQYTLVFCKECTFDSLADAIRNGDSVAVRDYNSDCIPFVAGNFRLAAYSYFLLREFFPLHDELCRIEGKILRSALRGECSGFPESPMGRHWEQQLFARFFGTEKMK